MAVPMNDAQLPKDKMNPFERSFFLGFFWLTIERYRQVSSFSFFCKFPDTHISTRHSFSSECLQLLVT